MPDYDFRSLSPHDFECISRDLLQEELGTYLESFTSGPDSGIDLRHYVGPTKVVLQCKHYADSPFSTLLARIRRERKNQIARFPTRIRYILTTSLGLTPARKKELFDVLDPYCKNTADIYGKDDLNNLLSKHPSIELNHHKLWLTSTSVLRRILDTGIISDSSDHLDDVRSRLSRYVPNDSLNRAMELLDGGHFCIISGIPGIGKTTLAEALLAYLVDRQGFSFFRITNRLEEIKSIKNRSEKQVFYFDDFLGRTNLVELERNEDRNLVDLMNEVSKNDRWRLVLTTREYILNAARYRYEAFDQLPKGLATCIVNLDDYTPFIRAKILYNHVYFSDLPTNHKLALLEDGTYRKIIDHKNYVPRMIQFMTDSPHLRGIDSKEYVTDFMENLSNPVRIWKHAFENQISRASRHLLLVLAVLPDRVCEEDAKECFWRFYDYRRQKYGFAVASGDWNHALDELDGSFLSTTKIGGYISIRFHNPSVEGFMQSHLGRAQGDVNDLLASAIVFEQYVRLWNSTNDRLKDDHVRQSWLKMFTRQTVDFVPGRSARRVVEDIVGQYQGTTTVTAEAQVRFLVKVVKVIGTDVGETVGPALGNLSHRWQEGRGDRENLLGLLMDLPKNLLDSDMEPILSARDFLLDARDTIEDFGISAEFYEAFPGLVSDEVLGELAERFYAVALNWIDYYDGASEGVLVELADMIENVGHVLDVDVGDVIAEINEKVGELQERASEELGDWRASRWDRNRAEYSAAEDVDQMFSQLRDHLANL